MAAVVRAALRATRAARMCRGVSTVTEFASLQSAEKADWCGARPHPVHNLVGGTWTTAAATEPVVDPLNGEVFLNVADTKTEELAPFLAGMKATSKTGLHNPFRNIDRYLMLGSVSDEASKALRTPAIADYFTKLIMRTSPKSYAQAMGEVKICAQFLDNFSGDQVRYLARSFAAPGDHDGQRSHGFRFPYGPVTLIAPFNFPLEIPVLQLMGALYMGNRVTLKVDSRVSVVMEQFLRLLQACGLPAGDVDFINCDGPTMMSLLLKGDPKMTLFTGSSRVAELLAEKLRGKIKIEDAGFDWKILGPDVSDADYVAWQCDQDAYACSGQKCSAQSMLFVHNNWAKTDFYLKLKALAARRTLDDLTIGPVLTWTTEAMLDHVKRLLAIDGAELIFGGEELNGGQHTIPKKYGALQPTAVFVPLRKMLQDKHYETVTTEVFGPLQVVTEYSNKSVDKVIEACDRMHAHLTAAIVSKDEQFRHHILGRTLNGTTYAGIRARTTGAPQNHWFGPAGDPRGAGIGTREAIQLVWSSHREVIEDIGPVKSDWVLPAAT